VLRNKIAIVTGASRGIGFATARALLGAGCRVALVGRNEPELSTALRELGDESNLALPGDVAEEGTFERAFDAAHRKFGRVDILVNCAGTIELALLAELELKVWEEVLATNLHGSFLGVREMFRYCKRHKTTGCVVNVSSLGGIRGTQKFPGTAAYVASKHGVIGLTESAAVEGKEIGVRVNCIAPGAVDTDMLRKAAPFLKTRFTPEDAAKTILFFCDEEQSGKISGSILEILSNE
jgi:Dehydrogenases with different specificities (related to short-chain alcohol dehydrogenases)